MDTETQEESQEVKWTIVIQCVKEGNNPPSYKIVMNYYGDAPVPILSVKQIKLNGSRKSDSRFSYSVEYGIALYDCNQKYIGYINC